jgi:hypothetical protein
MSTDNTPPSTGRKIFVFTFLSLVLVVFPAVSWLYLRNGLNWQRAVRAELGSYGKIRPVYRIEPGDVKTDQIKGKVCLLHLFPDGDAALDADNKAVLDMGARLYKQFRQNDAFRLVMISDDPATDLKAHYQTLEGTQPGGTWIWAGGTGSWRTILQNAYESYTLAEKTKPVKSYLALSDTTGTIRCFYNLNQQTEVDLMVAHVALLLPN